MSLGNKLKDFFTSGGCVLETKHITLDTIQDALNLIKDIKSKNISDGAPKVLMIVEQLVYWVEVMQKDMDLVKYDKLRTIIQDIAAIKIQLMNMTSDIEALKSAQQEETSVMQDECISKIKDTVKKIKKQKENKDDNQ